MSSAGTDLNKAPDNQLGLPDYQEPNATEEENQSVPGTPEHSRKGDEAAHHEVDLAEAEETAKAALAKSMPAPPPPNLYWKCISCI